MSTLPFHLPRDPLRRWKKSYMSTIVAVLALLLGPAGLHKRGAAVTFTVNSSADEVDVAPGDGVCNTGSACTLRAAVMEANALPGADSIVLPDGDYVFSIPGNDDAAATGDLDITSEVAINGTAANYVTIDASALDRVFDVRPSGNLSLTGVSVVGGWDIAGTGGGIRNEGALTLVRAEVRDNRGPSLHERGPYA
jgi:CSLREA domain-containing protein